VQPSTNNVLNLLLGATTRPTSVGTANAIGTQVPSDMLFGDLLGLLGGNASGVGAGTTVETEPDQRPIFAMLPKKDNFGPGSLPLMIPVSFIQDMLQPPTQSAGGGQFAFGGETDAAGTNPQMSPITTGAQDASVWPVLTRPITSFGAVLNELTGAQQSQLTDGAYTILSAQKVDDKLKLEVAFKDNPKQIIKLTLPINWLQSVTEGAVNSAEVPSSKPAETPRNPVRVPLKGVPIQQTSVEQLLPKLNLKEMEIRFEQPRTSQPIEPATAQVTLTGDKGSQAVILSGVINKNELIKALKPTTRNVTGSTSTLTDPVTSEAEVPRPLSGATKPPSSPAAKSAATEDNLDWAQFDKRTRFDGMDQISLDKTGQTADFSKGDPAVKNPEQKLNPPAVRFTLPDNLAQAVKSRSQSVMIKIEPEHLGPARLNLSVHNDVLTARLTVDTSQAKAAVEGSLDRLTEQLSRAGIRINHIEVSLRGGDSQNQFAGRQPDWYRPQRFNLRFTDESFLSTVVTPATPIPVHMPSYVGAGGVNLYA
jgi:hypothetical protein